MSDLHTLASGAPPKSFGSFGFTGGTKGARADKIFAMLVGYPGPGKSYFLSSNPGALILNFDCSRTKPNVEAQVFPVPGDEGFMHGADGKKFKWTYDEFKKLQQKLVEASNNNLPRPTTIVIDTLMSFQTVVESKFGSNWNDLGNVYDVILQDLLVFRDAGYGVWINSHFQKVKSKGKSPSGEDITVVEDDITHSPALHKRLFPLCEMVALLGVENETVTVDLMMELNGKQIKRGTTTKRVAKYILYPDLLPDDSKMNRPIIKRRVTLPERIELPSDKPWAAFEAIYNTAS